MQSISSTKIFLGILMVLLSVQLSTAQDQDLDCKIEIDEVDPFDSMRTVITHAVDVGYYIPSLFETEDGPKLIEEAKMVSLYSEKDSIKAVFITFVVPEYHFQVIEKGFNVKVLTDSSEVFGFYNVPDEGVFDKTSNMRVYQHTCLIPMDTYYKLTFNKIRMIRINYRDHERTIEVGDAQATALREALQCLGNQVGFWPIKP